MTTYAARFFDFVAGRRILLQKLAILCAFAFVLFAAPAAALRGWWGEVSELAGFALLCSAALGRVWCLVFIGGAKNALLVTEGPYSVVRNPLYVFNFLGAAGFGLAAEQPWLTVVLVCAFSLYYPIIVSREERVLLERFGDLYRAYQRQTPRWIPRFAQYREPAAVTLDPRWIRKGILDSMWILWAFLAWELIEHLHEAGTLPSLF